MMNKARIERDQQRDQQKAQRAAVLSRKMKEMSVEENAMFTWKPSWGEHPFTLIGERERAMRYTAHYDKDNHEPSNADFIATVSFDSFIDVGAAFGYYSCLLKSANPDLFVVAVEADPLRYGCLLRNLSYYEDVLPLYGMVGNYDLRINEPTKMGDIRVQEGPKVKSQYALDLLLAQRPADKVSTLIKVDIEGGEGELLQSSREILGDPNLKWMIEVHPWSSVSAESARQMFLDAGRQNVWLSDRRSNRLYVT